MIDNREHASDCSLRLCPGAAWCDCGLQADRELAKIRKMDWAQLESGVELAGGKWAVYPMERIEAALAYLQDSIDHARSVQNGAGVDSTEVKPDTVLDTVRKSTIEPNGSVR